MGYVLLWAENLGVSLLLVATLLACIGRLRWRPVRLGLSLLVVLPLLIFYGGVTGAAAHMKFNKQLAGNHFDSLLALTICFLIGAIWLLRRARPRASDELPAAAAWPRGRLAIALVVAVALHMMTFWNLDLSVRQRIAELQSDAGRLALSVAPARLADRDNAALIYQRAFEAMGPDNSWPKAWDEKWADGLGPKKPDFDLQDPALKEFLRQQTPALLLLRQAAQKPGCYFDRDYGRPSISMLLPELAQLRRGSRLLALDVRFQAAQGNVAQAIRDVGTMYAMSQHSGSDPLLIAMLVAIAVDATASDSLQFLLANASVSTEDLALVDIDESVSYRRLLERSFRMEEAFGMYVFGQMGEDFDLRMFEDGPSPGPTGIGPLYRVFLLNDDLIAHRRAFESLRSMTGGPYYDTKDRWTSFEKNVVAGPRGLLTSMLLPALAKCAETAARGDAKRDTARVALAACRYRIVQGHLPEKLDQLIPEYMTVVPRDPFDGKPLRWKRTDGGGVVYSIGPDSVDDGGAPFDKENKKGDDKKKGDIAFHLPALPQ